MALWPTTGIAHSSAAAAAAAAASKPHGVALWPAMNESEATADVSAKAHPNAGDQIINLSGPRDAMPESDDIDAEGQTEAHKFLADSNAPH